MAHDFNVPEWCEFRDPERYTSEFANSISEVDGSLFEQFSRFLNATDHVFPGISISEIVDGLVIYDRKMSRLLASSDSGSRTKLTLVKG